MEELSEKELEALISLLDDPDSEVYGHVSDKLTSLGLPIIPKLEHFWEEAFDSILQDRIGQIIHLIQLDDLKAKFQQWIDGGTRDLYDGAVLVARYQYPDLDEALLKTEVEHIRRAIWLEMNYHLTPFEQVNVFNHVFYTLMGYSGKTEEKHDSKGFFLNNVIEHKKGNALSLGVLYLILAQDLDMPVYGVDLPRHFVLAFTKDFMESFAGNEDTRDQVIFYINALNKGTIFTRNEIKLFLKKMDMEPKDEYFTPIDNKAVVRLLLQNLALAYEDENEHDKAKEVNELVQLLD